MLIHAMTTFLHYNMPSLYDGSAILDPNTRKIANFLSDHFECFFSQQQLSLSNQTN